MQTESLPPDTSVRSSTRYWRSLKSLQNWKTDRGNNAHWLLTGSRCRIKCARILQGSRYYPPRSCPYAPDPTPAATLLTTVHSHGTPSSLFLVLFLRNKLLQLIIKMFNPQALTVELESALRLFPSFETQFQARVKTNCLRKEAWFHLCIHSLCSRSASSVSFEIQFGELWCFWMRETSTEEITTKRHLPISYRLDKPLQIGEKSPAWGSLLAEILGGEQKGKTRKALSPQRFWLALWAPPAASVRRKIWLEGEARGALCSVLWLRRQEPKRRDCSPRRYIRPPPKRGPGHREASRLCVHKNLIRNIRPLYLKLLQKLSPGIWSFSGESIKERLLMLFLLSYLSQHRKAIPITVE